MPQRLRPLAITVDEPSAGSYRWRIVERRAEPDGDTEEWTELQAAPKRFKTYSKAMAAGLLQLQSLIADLDEGPRDEPTNDDGPGDAEDGTKSSGDKTGPSGRFFGFGSA
jgi:hypothetical protein